MKTKRITLIFALIAAAFALTACSVTISGDRDVVVARGSGDMTTETRQVSGFDAITIDGFGKLIITQGDTESLKIEAEDNILPHITSKVEGNTLHLGFDNDRWQVSIVPTETITFYLTVKDLRSVNLSGAADIQIDELDTDRLSVNISGAGNADVGNLKAETVDVTFSGAGKCTLNGEVQEQTVKVSGLGDYDASDLRSQSTSITLSGAGSIKVWAEEALDVTVSGAGNVEYWGNPRVTQDVSGLGNINSRGSK
jgi:predicted small secreted protein